jgi:hypothetical protein
MVLLVLLPSYYLSSLTYTNTLSISLINREQLIAGVVIRCIALGLLLSTLIFGLVWYY